MPGDVQLFEGITETEFTVNQDLFFRLNKGCRFGINTVKAETLEDN